MDIWAGSSTFTLWCSRPPPGGKGIRSVFRNAVADGRPVCQHNRHFGSQSHGKYDGRENPLDDDDSSRVLGAKLLSSGRDESAMGYLVPVCWADYTNEGPNQMVSPRKSNRMGFPTR